MKILIVDDNADDRKVLRYTIEAHGHEVIAAENGQEGLEMAAAHRPDLIISDALMPVMDGFQFLRNIKQNKNLSSIPFVFYSATYKGYQDVDLAIALGAEGYIIKPKEPLYFWEEVEQIVMESKQEKVLTAELIEENSEYLQKYSQIVAAKLEEKVRELEDALSERKRAEEKIKESEEKFRSVTALAQDAIIIMDNEGNISFWNKAAEKIFGYAQEEALGKELHTLLAPPEVIEEYKKGFALFKNTGEGPVVGKTTELSAIKKDGTRFQIELSISSLLIKKQWCATGIIRDITSRKKAEQDRENALRQRDLILKSAGDGIVGLDIQGNIIFINPSSANMFGYEDGELLGKNIHSISHHTKADGSPYPEKECPIYKAFNDGEVHYIRDEVFWRKDGSSFHVSYTSTPVRDNGQLVGAVLTFRDITKLKEAEEERRKLRDQLHQALKMEAIGQLTGGIAHDFNNIISAMMGFITLQQMQFQEGGNVTNYSDQMFSLAERAAALIQNLMAFSRKQVLDIKPANFNDIISAAAKLLMRIIGEDIKLNLILSDKDIVVNADAGQIEQVLMNLATNARDAMPEGGTLTISAGPVEMDENFINMHGFGNPGIYALLSVEDTGMGIDEQTREKIFEPFFTTKGVGKGTGLGLAMVYGIIKQHNGYINVYSEPGKGTTFRMYLPAVDAKAEEAKTPERIPWTGGTETILLVEDEASLRHVTGRMLERFGYRVIEAEDGNDAVNKFNEYKDEIKLVIMDVIMPNKNGKDAYRDMQKTQPDVKVIFTSGHSGDILTGKKISEEGLHFIPKPVSPRELLDKIRDVLDK